ncbi:MAG: KH domain-containing protein [Clostridia bacterium]
MRELVDLLVSKIIERESYDIVLLEDDNNVEIKVFVDKNKIAKLIGRNGRIARSIRTIVKATAQTTDKRYDIYIEERE